MSVSDDSYRLYNLPGFGLVRTCLYPTAKRFYDFVDNYDHVKCLSDIDQLGPIRQVLPGAHHTRYEYLMAQLAIITELCQLKGPLPTGLSLTRCRDTFGTLEGVRKGPSNGEILMVLALLGNIGHLPSTFSGERAFMKWLRDRPGPREAFRLGIPDEDRPFFDHTIDEDRIYQFNYCIAIFLLNRYRRRTSGHSIADFGQAIIRSFVNVTPDDADQPLAALWSLYRSIRRLTYLALDSHYAPVPFSLDLASIFFSLEHFLSDVFLNESAFQNALRRLEGVMRDTVYMGPDPLINHARVSDTVLKSLDSIDPEPRTIGALWQILGPDRNVAEHFQTPKRDKERDIRGDKVTLQLSYDIDPVTSNQLLPDPIEWERAARTAVGLRSCRFAADFDPTRRHLKVTAAVAGDTKPGIARKVALRVAKQLLDFEGRVVAANVKLSPSQDTENGRAFLRFLLPQLLGESRRFRLRTMPAVESSPVVRLYGSTRAAERVSAYRRWAGKSPYFTQDTLNEIDQLEHALRAVDYRRALVAFAGSTEVVEAERIVAEFDGLVVLLSRDTSQPILLVVEAKNTSHGHTAAANQLRDQFDRLQIPAGQFYVEHLGTKGAYATITID